ncbi:MAG TPA: hypothetical protein VN664_16730 [Burkholderiales bacterium]|nr:hypothetical protein [Burkholderiales bacterium]
MKLREIRGVGVQGIDEGIFEGDKKSRQPALQENSSLEMKLEIDRAPPIQVSSVDLYAFLAKLFSQQSIREGRIESMGRIGLPKQ